MVQQETVIIEHVLGTVEDVPEDDEYVVSHQGEGEDLHALDMDTGFGNGMENTDYRGQHHRLADNPKIADILPTKSALQLSQHQGADYTELGPQPPSE